MFIDIIVFIFIAVFLVLGIVRGFIVSLIWASWVVGILSAWLFSGIVEIILTSNIEGLSPIAARCLGVFLAFLIPFLLVRIATKVVDFFVKKSAPLTFVNRVLGGIFGVLKGIAISAIMLTIIHLLPAQGSLKQARDSSFAYSIYKVVPFDSLWKEINI
ncbi:MAG: CvpA family protein [Fibromonadaceae bacterium]|jgi:membrane protein required for colicin V production|nr:CvpA family protein [Fibromonadaceae bacterium]